MQHKGYFVWVALASTPLLSPVWRQSKLYPSIRRAHILWQHRTQRSALAESEGITKPVRAAKFGCYSDNRTGPGTGWLHMLTWCGILSTLTLTCCFISMWNGFWVTQCMINSHLDVQYSCPCGDLRRGLMRSIPRDEPGSDQLFQSRSLALGAPGRSFYLIF